MCTKTLLDDVGLEGWEISIVVTTHSVEHPIVD
eukprot:SAG11_NODE_17406_length_519_cov_5.928571_1_plen_32_part_01